MPTLASIVDSPDLHGAGLTSDRLDALRYDGQSDHPLDVAGMFQALMPSNSRVLDIGCGTGSVTLIANSKKSNTVIAVEPDTERASVARSRGLLVHNQYLDEAFLQAHAPFDVVMSSDVLEHTPNPSALLDLMARAVSPNGIVLISVPNVAHWTVRLNLLWGRFDYEPFGIMDVTHLRWFTAKSISALVRQCGFTLIEMRHTAGFQLPVYGNRYFRRLPKGPLVWAIAQMTKLFPRLFGVQHVLVLKPTSERADFRPAHNQ